MTLQEILPLAQKDVTITYLYFVVLPVVIAAFILGLVAPTILNYLEKRKTRILKSKVLVRQTR